ncbi:MAG: dipeptide/oligopeptide/nickel ABC transporter ATP-binding protein [Candidatus Saganbacteria bacterium]|nr:dipeptide/oligopeptide/nickel ABC transporter ATP-binding protein [Candidatus Saganbacteria bacterium]
MSGNIIEADGLSKKYGGFAAVKDASFFINKGEVFGIVGESGSGKTTLARLILGLTGPDSGELKFLGQETTKCRDLRKKMQVVFQDPISSLDPRMRIRDIIAEPLLIHDICPRNEIPKKAAELLSEAGLTKDYLNRYPHEISGGEAQRVCITRAVSTGPSFIVLDEPVSSLDFDLQKKIIGLLMRLKEEKGLTYLFITHDLSLARHICDRIAVMKAGSLIETGTPDEIFNNPSEEYTRQLIEDLI